MNVSLEFSPEEAAALTRHAQAQGKDVEAVLHGLVAQIAPSPKPELNERQRAAIVLMQQWREEDKTDDPEELEERDRELEEFKANMNRWRAEEGRLPVY